MRNREKRYHNYQKKLDQLVDNGTIDIRPGFTILQVRHDNWCNLLNGRGACNCNPDIIQEIPSIHKEQK